MTHQPRSTALVIMAKAPEAGLAKTRLIPALGAEGAAQLAKQLLDHTIRAARQASALNHLELCVTPHTDHPTFSMYKELTITEQAPGDLGQRMLAAFERVLSEHDRAIMIGTDAPGITAAALNRAAVDLAAHDAVFIPALDGGYALVGLKKVWPALLTDMPWSTAHVMQTTRERLKDLDLRWLEYTPVADIDEEQDLIHLPEGFVLG